ncbi:MAG: hypothetical protein ACK5D5_11510 [Bacteroidota bacterium]
MKTVRTLFFEATKSKAKTESMIKYLQNKNTFNDPVLKGYLGMSHILLAKHGFNFFTRLNNFNKGKEILEDAISRDKNNIELRFLRLTVQMNVPGVLNYSSNIDSDKKIIRDNFSKIKEEDLKIKVKQFYESKKMPI